MSQRETISISAESENATAHAAPLRATIVRPDHAATTKPPVVILHKGLAFSETDVDFLDELADALANAGLITIIYEPRTTDLILEDFHAFTLSQSIGDLRALIQYARSITGADATRIGIVAWSFGATAAIEAARQAACVSRMCLINPATPSFIVNRAMKAAAAANAADPEPLPRAVVEKLMAMVESKSRIVPSTPSLIIHAAADRVVPASVSFDLQPQPGETAPPVERIVVARADHDFTDAAVRIICFERIAAYLAAMTPVTAAPTTQKVGA